MKATIDLSQVVEDLEDCEPGDEYTLTFKVDSKTDEELTGTASDVEHTGEYAEDGEEMPEEEMMPRKSGHKMPKAIAIVISKPSRAA